MCACTHVESRPHTYVGGRDIVVCMCIVIYCSEGEACACVCVCAHLHVVCMHVCAYVLLL